MKTTVYEVETSTRKREWMWDSEGETVDLEHLNRAFGFLANDSRRYEVEQNGKVVLSISKTK